MTKVIVVISVLIITIFIFCRCDISKNKSSTNNTKEVNNKIMDSISYKLEVLSTITSKDFNPMFITQMADKFILLGKDEALSEISKFANASKISSDNFGLFLLLRIMFDVPASSKHPEINIGKFDHDKPTDGNETNLFPILYSNEIPFLIVTGYYTGGFPQSINDHIDFYKEFGILKKKAYHLQIEKSEETLFNEFNLKWCKIYTKDKMPNSLESSIKEQIRKTVASKI